jgi:hypothetical protein
MHLLDMQDLSGQRYVWRVLPGQRKETPNQLLEEAERLDVGGES